MEAWRCSVQGRSGWVCNASGKQKIYWNNTALAAKISMLAFNDNSNANLLIFFARTRPQPGGSPPLAPPDPASSSRFCLQRCLPWPSTWWSCPWQKMLRTFSLAMMESVCLVVDERLWTDFILSSSIWGLSLGDMQGVMRRSKLCHPWIQIVACAPNNLFVFVK